MVALTEQLNSHKNTTDSGNEELKELEKQYRELSELVLSLK